MAGINPCPMLNACRVLRLELLSLQYLFIDLTDTLDTCRHKRKVKALPWTSNDITLLFMLQQLCYFAVFKDCQEVTIFPSNKQIRLLFLTHSHSEIDFWPLAY